MSQISEFNTQGLSNTAWSLAKLSERFHGPLMEAISAEALRRGYEANFGGQKHSYALLWSAWLTSGDVFEKIFEMAQGP